MKNIRFSILNWLKYSVFKQHGGEIPNNFILLVYHVLFPLNYMYEKQSFLKYDFPTNTYIIDGMKFSYDIFKFLKDGGNKGKCFRLLTTKDGICTLENIDDELKAKSL